MKISHIFWVHRETNWVWLGAVHVIETRLWGVAGAASRRPTGMQKTNVVMIRTNTYLALIWVPRVMDNCWFMFFVWTCKPCGFMDWNYSAQYKFCDIGRSPFIQEEYKVKKREISKYFIGIMRGKYVGRVEGGFPQQWIANISYSPTNSSGDNSQNRNVLLYWTFFGNFQMFIVCGL